MNDVQIMRAIALWKRELEESMSEQRREEIEANIARLQKRLSGE